MKICWDDLDGVKLSRNGDFIKNSVSLVYREECKVCKLPFLTEKRRPSLYCSHRCVYDSKEFKEKLSIVNTGVNNSMFNKTHPKKIREQISKNRKGKLTGKENPNYGGLKNSAKKKLSKLRKGKSYEDIFGKEKTKNIKTKMSITRKGQRLGKDNPAWKGGSSFEPYCEIWIDSDYKNSIKERDGNICLNPYCTNNSNNLCLHHIDYNKKNCHPLNLITLCNSCNSKANADRNWHESWYSAIIYRRYIKCFI